MPKKAKRVVVIADKHSGHRVGLTHPDCEVIGLSREGRKWANARKKLYGFYAKTIDALQPIDVLLVNADCIDGRGERSGGTELLTANRREQCEIAAACIQYTKAKTIIMTRGTDYHTGREEEWEDEIALMVGAKKIGNHEWVEVNGLVFDVKHFVGSSQVDHGRHTATAREKGWSQLWAESGQSPKSDIILRSHVHYHRFCGGPGWLAMTTPALQGLGSRFGSKKMSGIVDFGLLSFDVDKDGGYTWQAHVTKSMQKSRVVRV